jgi:hypothetical protein
VLPAWDELDQFVELVQGRLGEADDLKSVLNFLAHIPELIPVEAVRLVRSKALLLCDQAKVFLGLES